MSRPPVVPKATRRGVDSVAGRRQRQDVFIAATFTGRGQTSRNQVSRGGAGGATGWRTELSASVPANFPN